MNAATKLSKIIRDDSEQVTPVVWRRLAARAATPAAASPRSDASSGEAAQLRAQLAELGEVRERDSRQAYEAGFAAGEAAARHGLEQQVRESVERLGQEIASLASLRVDTIARAEGDTVRLAIEIARRILHREVAIDPSAPQALMRAALEKLQSQEIGRVRVHPELEPALRDCLERAGRTESIEIVRDPAQPRGGIVFEISRGSLDASIETQLQEIERGLVELLEARI